MIACLFIGCTLFARNQLKGQPALQQRLVKLPIYVGLASDVSAALWHEVWHRSGGTDHTA